MDAARRGPVLVVEDHPVNRMLLERVLELEQIDVVCAGSMAEARHVLASTVPPLIVLDLQLPDGYGLDLVHELRSDPRTSQCVIVACTARQVPDEEQLARSIGCAEFVTKPIDTRNFATLVSSHLATPVVTGS
jgi:two-component system response regulator PilR (NtrC family)